MNFFEAQDQRRRLTRWLVVVYIAATLAIVAGVTAVVTVAFVGIGDGTTMPDPLLLAGIAAATMTLIGGASLYRTASLSAGGSKVAEDLGGTPIGEDEQDPLRRRLRNVVEEIAIASGVPVPAIYVLDREQGINAFAAGFTVDDAAVAVTQGALETLDRQELQGVIAHEFSHILNGDMRLNIRLMGVLFGIMVIAMIGRGLLRSSHFGGMRAGGRDRNGNGIALVGLGLAVLGGIGMLAARLIKAAVSRQREYLADASAVQFTRQTEGIANALKKIGGYSDHSYLKAADAEEISHMLFARGAKLSSLFATHPPLPERIRALDPSFDGEFLPSDTGAGDADAAADARAAGFSSGARVVQADAATVLDSIGQPQPEHIAYAEALHDALPDALLTAARSREHAWLIALALFLPRDAAKAAPLQDYLGQRIGASSAALVADYARRIAELGERFDFALLEVALPALRSAGTDRWQFLVDTGRELAEHDGVVEMREFCLYQVLVASLEQAAHPSRRTKGRRSGKRAVRQAALTLVSTLAEHGQREPAARRLAFEAGTREFGAWGRQATMDTGATNAADLASALAALRSLNPDGTQTLMKAALATVLADDTVTVAESEILRTLCASLYIPLPPVVALPDGR